MSAAPKFTPGPWVLNPTGGTPMIGFDVRDGGPLLPIVSVVHGYDTDEARANARLIAAAPRMFDFVERAALAGDSEAIAIVEVVNGRAERMRQHHKAGRVKPPARVTLTKVEAA